MRLGTPLERQGYPSEPCGPSSYYNLRVHLIKFKFLPWSEGTNWLISHNSETSATSQGKLYTIFDDAYDHPGKVINPGFFCLKLSEVKSLCDSGEISMPHRLLEGLISDNLKWRTSNTISIEYSGNSVHIRWKVGSCPCNFPEVGPVKSRRGATTSTGQLITGIPFSS